MFAERKGQGKVPWDQLCDEAAKERARQNSGLGASQTAEVAYLERMGLTFVEQDIREIKAFIAGAGEKMTEDRVHEVHEHSDSTRNLEPEARRP